MVGLETVSERRFQSIQSTDMTVPIFKRPQTRSPQSGDSRGIPRVGIADGAGFLD
jgi:hypothetical protein